MLLMSMGLPIFIRCVATLWCCLVAGLAKTVGGILAYIYLLLLLCTVERKN